MSADHKMGPFTVKEHFCKPSLGISFSEDYELVSSWQRLYFRKKDQEEFKPSPIHFEGLHATVFNPNDHKYYAVDSDKGCLVVFDQLSDSTSVNRFTSIAGMDLIRPHDVLYDSGSGWVYVLDANNGNVFRLKSIGVDEAYMNIPEKGYFRGLTMVDSKLYVTYSSHGIIIEVVHFDTGETIQHESFGKKANDPYGSWETSGLIINDIAHYNGWWYATNYFDLKHSRNAKHIHKNKFIRFKNWDNLKEGTWNDVSYLLSDTLIPYYLSVHEERLFLATFSGKMKWHNTCVLEITTAKE